MYLVVLRLYYPQNNEENIDRRDIKDFIASMKVFQGIQCTDFSITASSFKKADGKYADTNALAALVGHLNLSCI